MHHNWTQHTLTVENVYSDGGLCVPHAASVVPRVPPPGPRDVESADGAIFQQVRLDTRERGSKHGVRKKERNESREMMGNFIPATLKCETMSCPKFGSELVTFLSLSPGRRRLIVWGLWDGSSFYIVQG